MNTTSCPEEEPEKPNQMQSLGGKARADSLTADQRSEIASKAAMAKWEKAGKHPTVPKATHDGEMNIDGLVISCANLDNGERVISDRSFALALGARGGGNYWKKRKTATEKGALLPEYLSSGALKPFISEEMVERLSRSITYKASNGELANGVKAEILPQICDIWIRAKEKGALSGPQILSAQKAYLLLKAFASVGIIALVDEATGFQYDRPRRDLEEQLKKFLSEDFRKWVRTFPTDYFKHLCRLRGVELRPDMKLPQYFGTITNNLIYRRLAPGLLQKLKERKSERGKPSNKLHSWLSEDVGFRAVLMHLGTVVGLMKIHTRYEDFEKQLNQISPIYPETPGLFDDPKDWESPKD